MEPQDFELNQETFGEQNDLGTTVVLPKSFIEKRNIKNEGKKAGYTLILIEIIKYAWSFIALFVMLKLGYSQQDFFDLFTNPAVEQVTQIVISILMFTLPFILVYKIGGDKISHLISSEKCEFKICFLLYLLGIAFCAYTNIITSLAGAIFENAGINYEVDMGQNPKGIFGFLLSIIATAVVPALVEEFACRGIVLGSLKRYGEGFALIVSSIVFGLMHGNFQQIPFAFFVGLALGFVTLKTGNLWTAVFIHGTNNLISVIMEYVFTGDLSNFAAISYNIYLFAVLILGLVAISFLKMQDSRFFSLKKSETESGEVKKQVWFFTSVPILIFIVIALLQSMQYFK